MKVILTANHRALEAQARAIAERFGLGFRPQRGRSLEVFAEGEGAEVVGVLNREGIFLWREGVRLGFSAGMAELRVKRVGAGQHDPLVALGELKPGDAVLDCTLGLARDALVMAAAGARVDGLEAEGILAALSEVGLTQVGGAAGQVASRIRVIHARSDAFLEGLAPRSYDVVYFDPMFGEEVEAAAEYQLFRLLADPAPILRASVERARQIARRAVILKDGPRAQMLKTLGIPLAQLTFGNRVRFGRIEPA